MEDNKDSVELTDNNTKNNASPVKAFLIFVAIIIIATIAYGKYYGWFNFEKCGPAIKEIQIGMLKTEVNKKLDKIEDEHTSRSSEFYRFDRDDYIVCRNSHINSTDIVKFYFKNGHLNKMDILKWKVFFGYSKYISSLWEETTENITFDEFIHKFLKLYHIGECEKSGNEYIHEDKDWKLIIDKNRQEIIIEKYNGDKHLN